VSSKESEDAVDDNFLSMGTKDTQNIQHTMAHELHSDQPKLDLLMANKLTLHPTTEDDVTAVDDFKYKMTGEVTGVVLEDDEDDEEFISLHTFAETNNLSMKMISLLEMKNKLMLQNVHEKQTQR